MDIRFCYEIHADAGMAHDTETNEPTSCYFQVKLGGAKNIEDYDGAHKRIGASIAKQYGWLEEWVKPISEEEHDMNADEDEGIDPTE